MVRTTSPRTATSRPTPLRSTAIRLFILVVSFALGAVVVATPAQAAYCGITWGSTPKTAGVDARYDTIADVRAGKHACYDRLVISLDSATGFRAYDVRYVDQVRMDGSGHVVPLRGGAKLAIVVRSTPYDLLGHVHYEPANPSELASVSGFQTFRQVAWAGAFEGQTTIGLGVRARLPFRVFTLPGPDAGEVRVVIDVAHLW